ncbi:MAG: DNA alkylation repair protein [Hymenobacteraceae bacterium]|nr:DNA alkylation repair protein [Hymenobacteraceae bacterium]MDX5396389.1 DNA alkylation repair protein [Hymenobacteraceae bacterium]MDX5443359.1 DNA alkylation repair protein [Hymenobacteraceae bacterium]MDX5512451.1 DNA alkylation repair protein [Hymenobacteraceae bacterium]
MPLSSKAENILSQIDSKSTKLGDLRKIAKDIKKDHELAMELWASGAYLPRQLAILIMDKKRLSEELIDKLDLDIQNHEINERLQLIDWLLANQLSKDKKTIALMESWKDSPSVLQRRTFWYYQGRLRWVGQTPPPNTEELLSLIEARIENEKPEVQWAMNFTAAQIGIFQPEFRTRCVALGERTGLYKDEVVARGCTPNYLPELISIQVAKLNK